MTTTTISPDDDDTDGYIIDTHSCGSGKAAFPTGTSMYCGSLTTICFNDGMRDVARTYISFPTKNLTGCIITNASLNVYFQGRVMFKGFLWNGVLDQRMCINVNNDIIGAAVDVSDWALGGTMFYNSTAFKVWSAAGWKQFLGVETHINTAGDTDFMIWPNSNWSSDCQAQNKHYYLRWASVESAGTYPYLEINYINNKGRKKQIRIYPRSRITKQRARGGMNG